MRVEGALALFVLRATERLKPKAWVAAPVLSSTLFARLPEVVLGVLIQVLCLNGIAARGSFSGKRHEPLMVLAVGSAGRALAPLLNLRAKPRAPVRWLTPHIAHRILSRRPATGGSGFEPWPPWIYLPRGRGNFSESALICASGDRQ